MEVDQAESPSSDGSPIPDFVRGFPFLPLPPADYVPPPTSRTLAARAVKLNQVHFGPAKGHSASPPDRHGPTSSSVAILSSSQVSPAQEYIQLDTSSSPRETEFEDDVMAIEGNHPDIPIWVPDSDPMNSDRPVPMTVLLDSDDDDIYVDDQPDGIPMTVVVSDSDGEENSLPVESDIQVIPDTVIISDSDSDSDPDPDSGPGCNNRAEQSVQLEGTPSRYTAASFSHFVDSWLE